MQQISTIILYLLQPLEWNLRYEGGRRPAIWDVVNKLILLLVLCRAVWIREDHAFADDSGVRAPVLWQSVLQWRGRDERKGTRPRCGIHVSELCFIQTHDRCQECGLRPQYRQTKKNPHGGKILSLVWSLA